MIKKRINKGGDTFRLVNLKLNYDEFGGTARGTYESSRERLTLNGDPKPAIMLSVFATGPTMRAIERNFKTNLKETLRSL
jgi:hypothetical protein